MRIALVAAILSALSAAAPAPVVKPFLSEDAIDQPRLHECLKELFAKYAPLGANNVRGFFGPYLGKPRFTAEYRVVLRQSNQPPLNVRMVFRSDDIWNYVGYYNAQQELRLGASTSAMDGETTILDLDGKFLFVLDLSDCRKHF